MTHAPSSTTSLFSGYDPAGFYDEVFPAAAGSSRPVARPHYRQLVDLLAGLDPAELERRQRQRDTLFRTLGITFAVYDDDGGQGVERTFPLDLVPRIIPAGEWNVLEAGLIQRVRALNEFLDDIYVGESACIADGIIPRWVVQSSDGFMRQAHGVPVPHKARCLVAGIDLVRDDSGAYVVLEDNVRNPSGVSYVVENRAAMTRVMPSAFEQYRVRPVDHYPNLLFDALRSVAPPGAVNPRVVILTPGVYNSAYFEHAFLARQMGVELVEGRDLVVDDHTLYMRATSGLERIDVLFRRIDDDFLDPVELRADSSLGVPGLLSAVRAGNVTVANALGNGAADDKAVYAYVPELIRYYLGEDPILANVATYLLWDKDQRDHVLQRLDDLVVKPVAESGGYGLVVGRHASDEQLAVLAEQIQADPRAFIAQETVGLSRHPTLVGDGLAPRHIDLRPYVVTGAETKVLAGGLTRVALREGSLVVNSSQGGGSKDTWVLEGGAGLMLARLAENLLWAGRYLERAEGTARLLDVTYHGMLETPATDASRPLRSLLRSLNQLGDFEATGSTFSESSVTRFLVTDNSNPGSVAVSVGLVRENIRSLREQVSSELWEAMNTFHLELEGRNLTDDLRQQRFELYGTIKQRCQMISGVADQTMPRNDGWRFFSIGRQLERVIMMGRLLESEYREFSDDEGADFHHWRNLLRAASAFEAYARSGRATLQRDEAFDYLMLDPEFPRSILFCLRSADALLERVSSPDAARPSQRALGRARAMVEFADPFGSGLERESALPAIVGATQHTLDAISEEFFVPARPGAVQYFGAF